MARKTVKPRKAKIESDDPFYDIIQDAYRVFKGPKPDAPYVCCDCCMLPEIEADFFGPAIEDMPLDYLQDWFDAAYDDPLPKTIWRYLLPRVLEVLAAGERPARVALEISLSRFPTGAQTEWSEVEWGVLDRFQRLYLARNIREQPGSDYLDDVLCMFAKAGWPVEALLAQAAAQPDASLATRLHSDWCAGRPCIWITAFWDGRAALAFYTSKALGDRMETLALAPGTPEDVAEKAYQVALLIRSSSP